MRRKWSVQIADALRFLHDRNPPVVHRCVYAFGKRSSPPPPPPSPLTCPDCRDIKPGNILLDINNNAKVTYARAEIMDGVTIGVSEVQLKLNGDHRKTT